MKCKILVFGGTTEGRVLAEYLRRYEIPHEVSVATEYGGEILAESGEENFLVGRKTAYEIGQVIEAGGFTIAVDATHPFATVVSEEIKKACKETGISYLRLKRNTGHEASDAVVFGNDRFVYADTLEDAVAELAAVEGNVLLLTGSKDLKEIADSFPDKSRLFVRVLPNEESIGKCTEVGLSGRQIIAMQGPFSRQMNSATIREIHAEAILTKESGKAGGLDDKLIAAKECGIKAVVLRNPENMASSGGYSLNEILGILSRYTGLKIRQDKAITLAGMGPGGEDYHTRQLIKALAEADIIFGAETVIRNLRKRDVPAISEYKADKIFEYLEANEEFTRPLVLFSGDISLCSGARKATEYFREKGYAVQRISGISSVTLFAQKLGLSLENVRIVSAHGRSCNVRGYVESGKEVIILASDAEHARSICRTASEVLKITCEEKNGFIRENTWVSETNDEIRLIVGCDLGTDGEKILDITSNPELEEEICGKCLIYVSNPAAAVRPVVRGLTDDEIIRGKTPMTKEEVRALSMRKLSLPKNAVFWDIGAGTGSISLEAALLSPEIRVFAVEKDDEAIALLQENKEKFGADNMEIIQGMAPEALDLPAPSHVFIGGSGGNMRQILDAVFAKNERAVVVINTVTAETFAEVMQCLPAFPGIEPDMIQVLVSRYKKAGRYHLAEALNPVYIITLRKGEER